MLTGWAARQRSRAFESQLEQSVFGLDSCKQCTKSSIYALRALPEAPSTKGSRNGVEMNQYSLHIAAGSGAGSPGPAGPADNDAQAKTLTVEISGMSNVLPPRLL
jgi:hypothetical protein